MYKVNEGIKVCKRKRVDSISKITGTLNVWIGITDDTKSGKKEKWKDVEGNEIGNAFVNLGVTNWKFFND